MLSDFRQFLLKQNIVALAIAVVVGAALNRLVQSFVDAFIMPIVAAISPSGQWKTAMWHLGPLHFAIGDFLSAVLNFLIIGLVAWRLARLLIRETGEPASKPCTFCRSKIDAEATRCPNCTSQLAPA